MVQKAQRLIISGASRVFYGHKDFVTDIIFRPHSNQVASSSFDGQIKLWDLAGRRELYSLNGHHASVDSIAFSENGRWLISGGWDGAIRVWNVDRVEEYVSLFAMRDSNDWLAVAPDGLFDGTANAMQQVAWPEPLERLFH
jgi:WD40 repeat protein